MWVVSPVYRLVKAESLWLLIGLREFGGAALCQRCKKEGGRKEGRMRMRASGDDGKEVKEARKDLHQRLNACHGITFALSSSSLSIFFFLVLILTAI